MKIALILLALLFAFVGGSELLGRNVVLAFPCLTIAAILFSGAAIVDAVDRNVRKFKP